MWNTLLAKLVSVRSKQAVLLISSIACLYLWVKMLGTVWAFLFWALFIFTGFLWIKNNADAIADRFEKLSAKIAKVSNWFNRPGL